MRNVAPFYISVLYYTVFAQAFAAVVKSSHHAMLRLFISGGSAPVSPRILVYFLRNLRHRGLYIRTVQRYANNVTSIYQLSNMQNAQGVARFRRLLQHNKIYRLVYRNTLKFFYKKLPQRPALKVS